MEDADIESITIVVRDADRTMLRSGKLDHRQVLVLGGRQYVSRMVSVKGDRIEIGFEPGPKVS